ncbi:hypothetical protein [Paenibacillus aceti]|uniref:Lipoprotein n=1 Tax=Paenibacillus aceti TaxID=1820010 RepID=A0ABQ1W1U6_9BACL|nr:hypothetical protein [Paenibacillus aceti]GGG09240.1 hypothetical protein GCM10010913_33810 [Paenibacillus aceti]
MMTSKWISVISIFCLTTVLLAACGSNESKPDNDRSAASDVHKSTAGKQEVLIDASFPKYNNLDELENRANLIIEGRVLSSTFKFLNVAERPSQPGDDQLNPGTTPADSPPIPYTIYDVEVQKVYKGAVTEKETIQVKQVGGENQQTIFKVNDTSELKEEGDYIMFLATFDNSPASLLNPIQGSYELVNNQIIASDKNLIKLEINDLKQLTE